MTAILHDVHHAAAGVVRGTKDVVPLCGEMSESVCPLIAAAQDGIASRLHDSVVQELYALSLGLEHLSKQALTLVGAIREEIYGLRTTGDLSWVDELALAVKTVSLFAEVEFCRIDVVPGVLRPVARDVVKEAVSNAIRHGKADHVTVDVRNDAGMLTVVVGDNGVGVASRASRVHGPTSLERRARALGGSCRLLPNASRGMSVQWQVPNKEENGD